MEFSRFIEMANACSGNIVLRKQTTFVDVAVNRDTYRINYHGKREFLLGIDRFDSISVHTEHPLLMDYLEPNVPVHLASKVDDKSRFREVLEETTTKVFGGWRSYERYLNLPLETFLEKPYGLLMTAPKTFAEFLANSAGDIGVRLILHKGHRPNGNPKVLIIDADYVIADEFVVEVSRSAEKIDA